MPATREQLIADWQKRLAAVSDVEDDGPSRAAWLARLQRRLYCFLLSLYGDGRWNAPPPMEMSTPRDGAESVVFDAPDVLPLAGKPAKSEGKIRSVLDAVASANTARQSLGPLVGVTNRKLTVVVTSRSGLDLGRCAQLLTDEGLVVRWGEYCGREAIYVPDIHAYKAREAIQARAIFLRRRGPAPIPKPSPAFLWFTLGIALAPLLALASAIAATWSYPDAAAKNQLMEATLYATAVFFALLSLIYVRPIGWLVQRIDRLACAAIKAASKPRGSR